MRVLNSWPLVLRLLPVLVLVTGLLLPLGAHGQAAPSTTITVWAWKGADDALKAIEPEFNAAYPDIAIDWTEYPPADQYRNALLAISAGSGAPDVLLLENSHLAQFVALGGLADITDRVQPYLGLMNQFKWAEATLNGRYYAMPWDSGPVGVFYRRDVFQNAGLDPSTINTWDDFLSAAMTIKSRTGVPMWQQSRAANDARLFEMLLWQQGLGYVDTDGHVTIDSPDAVRTLEYIGGFWQDGLALDQQAFSNDWFDAQNKGSVATVPEAVWMGTILKRDTLPEAYGHWGVFALPAWIPGGVRASNDGGSALTIPDQSQHKDAAWAFIEFALGRDDSQLKMYAAQDLFPALETTYSDVLFQTPDPFYGNQNTRQLFADIVKQVPQAGIYSADYSEMNSITASEIQKYAQGQVTAQQALANAAQLIRERTGRS